jgi:predicted Zn finger-like uncharacterized protein
MLLICPECSAKYNVADGAIPAAGRAVRCAACHHGWTQMPEAPIATPENLSAEADKYQTNNGLRRRPKGPPPPPAEPHARMRKRVHDKIEMKHRLAAGVPWGIAACLAIGAIGAAIIYRTDIVRAWPKSASAFALIGKPANLYGIDIRGVQARAGIDVKGPRVVVTGVLASVSRKPEPVAYLKVKLVDSKGVEKLSWLVDPGVTVLQPGKNHVFETARSNPLLGDVKAIVVFAEPPPKAPRPPPEPPTGKSGLMGAVAPNAAPNAAPTSATESKTPETVSAR